MWHQALLLAGMPILTHALAPTLAPYVDSSFWPDVLPERDLSLSPETSTITITLPAEAFSTSAEEPVYLETTVIDGKTVTGTVTYVPMHTTYVADLPHTGLGTTVTRPGSTVTIGPSETLPASVLESMASDLANSTGVHIAIPATSYANVSSVLATSTASTVEVYPIAPTYTGPSVSTVTEAVPVYIWDDSTPEPSVSTMTEALFLVEEFVATEMSTLTKSEVSTLIQPTVSTLTKTRVSNRTMTRLATVTTTGMTTATQTKLLTLTRYNTTTLTAPSAKTSVDDEDSESLWWYSKAFYAVAAKLRHYPTVDLTNVTSADAAILMGGLLEDFTLVEVDPENSTSAPSDISVIPVGIHFTNLTSAPLGIPVKIHLTNLTFDRSNASDSAANPTKIPTCNDRKLHSALEGNDGKTGWMTDPDGAIVVWPMSLWSMHPSNVSKDVDCHVNVNGTQMHAYRTPRHHHGRKYIFRGFDECYAQNQALDWYHKHRVLTIVLASVLPALALLAGLPLLCWCCHRHRQRKRQEQQQRKAIAEADEAQRTRNAANAANAANMGSSTAPSAAPRSMPGQGRGTEMAEVAVLGGASGAAAANAAQRRNSASGRGTNANANTAGSLRNAPAGSTGGQAGTAGRGGGSEMVEAVPVGTGQQQTGTTAAPQTFTSSSGEQLKTVPGSESAGAAGGARGTSTVEVARAPGATETVEVVPVHDGADGRPTGSQYFDRDSLRDRKKNRLELPDFF